MFVSAHDALLLMVIAVFAGVVAVRAAQLFATNAMQDVEALRDTLVAVGEGSRAPPPSPEAPTSWRSWRARPTPRSGSSTARRPPAAT